MRAALTSSKISIVVSISNIEVMVKKVYSAEAISVVVLCLSNASFNAL